ncbi:hypothetical protein Sjap_017175 [Stephania japonica]|uniref:Uncharacterized protein n=1 Tax=Stephania japonica TaxID=461633 RepID=A0AAP0I5N5_9MAGN
MVNKILFLLNKKKNPSKFLGIVKFNGSMLKSMNINEDFTKMSVVFYLNL